MQLGCISFVFFVLSFALPFDWWIKIDKMHANLAHIDDFFVQSNSRRPFCEDQELDKNKNKDIAYIAYSIVDSMRVR